MPIDSQPVQNTLSLGKRAPLFSRENLQHYQLPIGGGGCRSNFAAASHVRGILAASATPAMKRAAIRLVADDLSISMDELRRHFLVVDEDAYRLDDAYRLVDAHRLATRTKYTFTWQRCLCSAGSTL